VLEHRSAHQSICAQAQRYNHVVLPCTVDLATAVVWQVNYHIRQQVPLHHCDTFTTVLLYCRHSADCTAMYCSPCTAESAAHPVNCTAMYCLVLQVPEGLWLRQVQHGRRRLGPILPCTATNPAHSFNCTALYCLALQVPLGLWLRQVQHGRRRLGPILPCAARKPRTPSQLYCHVLPCSAGP
jgi:ABC-type proline/glycine betaine transport system permease subunit